MTWVSFALALLKLVNSIISWAHKRELISEGYRQALAEQAFAIATKVQTKKAIQERVDAMSEAEVDDALHGLEPPPGAKRVQTGAAR
jgi:hypothetical protein